MFWRKLMQRNPNVSAGAGASEGEVRSRSRTWLEDGMRRLREHEEDVQHTKSVCMQSLREIGVGVIEIRRNLSKLAELAKRIPDLSEMQELASSLELKIANVVKELEKVECLTKAIVDAKRSWSDIMSFTQESQNRIICAKVQLGKLCEGVRQERKDRLKKMLDEKEKKVYDLISRGCGIIAGFATSQGLINVGLEGKESKFCYNNDNTRGLIILSSIMCSAGLFSVYFSIFLEVKGFNKLFKEYKRYVPSWSEERDWVDNHNSKWVFAIRLIIGLCITAGILWYMSTTWSSIKSLCPGDIKEHLCPKKD